MNRVCGILILNAWDLRRAARRVFPGSRPNQRRWMRAWVRRPPRVCTPIGGADPPEFLRNSHIPYGELHEMLK